MSVDPEIIARIRKLFALANGRGATEAEAASALEKANDMLLRHNLSADAVSSETPAEKVTEQSIRLGRRDSWRHRLIIILAKHNLCDCFYSGERIVVVGRPTNIAVSREMFDWISPQLIAIAAEEYKNYVVDVTVDEDEHRGDRWCPVCDRWRESFDVDYDGKCYDCDTRVLLSSRVHGKTWKTNFMRGILQRIQHRLYEQRQSQKTSTIVTQAAVPSGVQVAALVLLTGQEVKSYLSVHHSDLVSRTRYQSSYHSGAIAAGNRRGNDVNLGGTRLGSGSRPQLSGR